MEAFSDQPPAQLATRIISDGLFPILVLSASEQILFANKAASEAFGYATTVLVGMRFVDTIDIGSRTKSVALLAATRRGPTEAYELNIIRGTGQIALIALQAIPLEAGHIALIGQMLAPTVATTERLIDTNRQLKALFSIATEVSYAQLLPDLLSSTLHVLIAELDLRAGAFLLYPAASTAYEALPRMVAHQGFARHFAQHSDRFLAQLNALFDARQDGGVHMGSLEELALVPEDLVGMIGPLLQVALMPVRSEDRLIGWLLAMSDTYRAFGQNVMQTLHTVGQLLGPPIEHARLVSDLIERSSQLQAVLDGIDSGVMLVDNTGIVRYANARLGTLLATDVSDWPGQRRSELVLERLVAQERINDPFEGELLLLPGISNRLLRHLMDSVADTTGEPLGTIEIFRDVTAVEEMNQLKDDFIASAAHDLKTPVTAVKGYAQIALRLARRLDEPRLVEQLERLSLRSDDLTYLIETLLDLSRIQNGRLQLELETFSLDDLLRQVAQRFTTILQRQRRTIELVTPQEQLVVRWDRARIGRVLTNLIENAVKYSPDGGEIRLEVALVAGQSEGAQSVELAVTDHGIGIPLDERSRVFERFYRSTSVIADGFSGTGLGLYITQQVVAAHGGAVRIDDARHGGQGTTVVLAMPQHAADASLNPLSIGA